MYIIKVSNYYTRCGVREKGKTFYEQILSNIPLEKNELGFDFSGVSFVSPSFLEESVFRFIETHQVSVIKNKKAVKSAQKLINWKKLKLSCNFSTNKDTIIFLALNQ